MVGFSWGLGERFELSTPANKFAGDPGLRSNDPTHAGDRMNGAPDAWVGFMYGPPVQVRSINRDDP